MEINRTAAMANSFGNAVEEYERSRPTYPAEAAAWLLPADAKTVLDLGAGTGKFTRSLVAKGLDVIAVEPDAVMLASLQASIPGVKALRGTAESIPLPDDSVDVVTIAQAWHWMNHALAKQEIARVLRPGGILALVYNLRDESVPWVKRLGEAMGRSEAERALDETVIIGEPFGEIETARFDWNAETTTESLIELVKSRSYVITATPEEREDLFERVSAVLRAEQKDTFTLPYNTFVFRARVAGQVR
jgi:SAM-dependent methyltransferase